MVHEASLRSSSSDHPWKRKIERRKVITESSSCSCTFCNVRSYEIFSTVKTIDVDVVTAEAERLPLPSSASSPKLEPSSILPTHVRVQLRLASDAYSLQQPR